MTRINALSAASLLMELFPNQVNEEQARFLVDRFKAFTEVATAEAIRAHRAIREFISIPQLLEQCRAACAAKTKSVVSSDREGSWADAQRRTYPSLRDGNDIEVILRVHWNRWRHCNGSAGYRNAIERSVRSLLAIERVSDEDIDVAVAAVFGSDADFRAAVDAARDSARSVVGGCP